MTIADKLNLLMGLTGTKNRRLAQELCVDPSLICRYRRGQRNIPLHAQYIAEIAAFFSERCDSESVALLGQILPPHPAAGRDLRTQLERWLLEDDELPLSALPLQVSAGGQKRTAAFRTFSGPQAWAEAIAAFSKYIRAAGAGCELKILQQSTLPTPQARAAFNQQLTAEILPFLQRGGNAYRILPQAASLTAETEHVKYWIAPMMTGNLQLFEYDGLQENALQTDLIVLGDRAALQSLRAAGETEVTVQLTTDRAAVAGLSSTADSYLVSCRPISRVCKARSSRRYVDPDDPEAVAPVIYVYTSLPQSSAPHQLLRPLQSMTETPPDLYTLFLRQMQQLVFLPEEQTLTELFPLLSPAEALAGAPAAQAAFGTDAEKLHYTPETYILHLRNILRQLENHANYHAVLIPKGMTQVNYCFVGSRQMSAFPLPFGSSFRLMSVSHSGMTCALRQQFLPLLQQAQADPSYRAGVIAQLQACIAEMQRLQGKKEGKKA